MLTVPAAFSWFKRKEPYVCALIVGLLFTPVIYWNATHQWASFLFQSTRRFAATTSIDLPYLFGLDFSLLLRHLEFWVYGIFLKKTTPMLLAIILTVLNPFSAHLYPSTFGIFYVIQFKS